MKAPLTPEHPILLVDDEADFLETVRIVLSAAGMNNVIICQDGRRVRELLAQQPFSVALIDMMMPHISGRELLLTLVEEHPELPTLVVTAVDEVYTAIDAIRTGAFDYLVKPVDEARLVTSVRRAIRLRAVQEENRTLRRYLVTGELTHPEAFDHIVTKSLLMRGIFQYLEAVSRTALPILVTGETGAGKELIAKAVHTLSGRTGKLVSLNVAGVDDNMLSDTLFGHKRGAFTGAADSRPGLIEQADGGTLFLDEIGDLSLASQVKLLRLLQDGTYYPVGSDVPKVTNARVIAATNASLEELVNAGKFRRDLFYRLQTHHVQLPPLRERKEDIQLLLEHFALKAAAALGKKPPLIPKELVLRLSNYDFPGNVRQLEAMVFDAVSVCHTPVLPLRSFDEKIGASKSDAAVPVEQQGNTIDQKLAFPETLPTLKEAEDLLVAEALRRAEGSQTLAAKLLGVSRQALNNRLRRERAQGS